MNAYRTASYDYAVIFHEWNEAAFDYEEVYVLTDDVEWWRTSCVAPLRIFVRSYMLGRK